MSFHSGICFSAGMLFGEEVFGYVWHWVHELANYRLTLESAGKVLKEHEKIVEALTQSRGKPDDIDCAVKAAQKHLFGAFIRNHFDERMYSLLVKQAEDHLRHFEEMKKASDEARGRPGA
jgi:hypothetical protein